MFASTVRIENRVGVRGETPSKLTAYMM